MKANRSAEATARAEHPDIWLANVFVTLLLALVAWIAADPVVAQNPECLCHGPEQCQLPVHGCPTLPPDAPCVLDDEGNIVREELIWREACPHGEAAWCATLDDASFDTLLGDSPASLRQQFCFSRLQPIPAVFTTVVSGGTLDMAAIAGEIEAGERVEIGRMTIDQDIGVRIEEADGTCRCPHFVMTFAMIVTKIDEDSGAALFDVRLDEEESINATTVTRQVLDYDPRDENHSNGLLFVGELISRGPDAGFWMSFRVPAERPGAQLAVEDSELAAPGFGVCAVFEYLDPSRLGMESSPYRLPPTETVFIDTELISFEDNLAKFFSREHDVVTNETPMFVRGDTDGDLGVDLSDAIFLLNALFIGGPRVTCWDAADANDDGRVDVSDVVIILLALFDGAPMPVPEDCAVDPSVDSLGDCTHPCGSG